MKNARGVAGWVCVVLVVIAAPYAAVAAEAGSIVGWGSQVVGADMSRGFAAVAVGASHSLGLRTDGSVVAWGVNGAGQCNVPEPNTGFVTVAAGGYYSLGLKTDGSVVAWGGYNEYGQCNVPEPNTGFVAVAAGGAQSLGLKADGSVVAWGDNSVGQCDVPEPNAGFVAVAAGGYYSLGLKTDGSVVAWGDNGDGECNVPEPNMGFVAVAAGGFWWGEHSLGLKADGSVVAWGHNDYGECDVPEPNTGFVAVSAGYVHNLGLKADGSVVAWGSVGAMPEPNAGFVAIAAGGISWGGVSLGLKADGSVVPWGNNEHGQCNVPEPNTGFVGLAAGYGHTLGLKTDGSVAAWGTAYYGPCNVPEPNTGYVAVAAHDDYSLGLKADGSILGWGHDWYGRCDVPEPNTGFVAMAAGACHGLGLKADGSVVAWGAGGNNAPEPNAGFVAVAAGGDSYGEHNLGLKADGSVVAWGSNNHGECNVPEPNAGFVAVAAGGAQSLGLKADGSVVAWGYNEAGQCDVPEPNAGFVAVAAGGGHNLGLKADGSVVAWGRNESGQCDVPEPNTGFVAVAADGDRSLALKGDARTPIPIALGERVAGTARPYGFTDYRLDLEAGDAQHLLVRVYPSSADGVWSVRGRYGSLPMWSGSDWTGEATSDPGVIEMLIPSPAAGEYFFSVYPYFGVGGAPVPFEIEVLPVERHLSRITLARGGNAGTATFQVRGLGFAPGMRLELRDGGNTVLIAQPTNTLTDTLTVRLDLSGITPGVYDVVLVWPSGAEATLPAAFEVIPGSGPRLDARLVVPPQVRPGRTYTLWVEYSNTGDADMLMPVFRLTNSSSALMQLGVGGRSNSTSLTFLGVSEQEPAAVLSPQEMQCLAITFVAPSGASIDFHLTSLQPDDRTVDWDALAPFVRPPDVDDSEWLAFWTEVIPLLGSTWLELTEALLPLIGDASVPVEQRADFRAALACAAGMATLEPQEETVFGPKSTPNPSSDVTVGAIQFNPDNNCTYVVTHGWNSSHESPSIIGLAANISQHCPDCNVLWIDWRTEAAEFFAAKYIPDVALAADARLQEQGYVFDWNTVTFVGHSYGNSVNRDLAAIHGGTGRAVILDPPNGLLGGNPGYSGGFSGGSLAIRSSNPLDEHPCSHRENEVDIADVQLRLMWWNWDHGGALNCLNKQLYEQSQDPESGCDNPWLNLEPASTRQGQRGHDGTTDCDGNVNPTPELCSDEEDPEGYVPGDPEASSSSDVLHPVDPNEKVGPLGSGSPETQRFVQPGGELSYVVYFENMCTATAPAQEVYVTDYLDTDLDWSTFRITEITWGAGNTVSIPADTSAFFTRVTVPDHRADVDKQWWVDVSVDINYGTGRVQWLFRTFDPDTGELPEDVNAGFLPPNKIGGECAPEDQQGPGEGHVAFTVKSKAGLSPETRIANTASIVFDLEAPIVTNEVFNTIGTETAGVPAVVGMTEANAQVAILAAGLIVGTVTEEYSATVAAGVVIGQDPMPGSQVLPGSAVSLVVSKGPQPVAVPNVVGMTQAAAETAIMAAGLAVGTVTEEYSITVPIGNVISQNPHAGVNVNHGTPVSLVLSRGAAEPPAGCSGGTLNQSTGGRSIPRAPGDTIALSALMAALVLGGRIKKAAIPEKLVEN